MLWFMGESGYLTDSEKSKDIGHRFLMIFGAMTQFQVLGAVVNKPLKVSVTIIHRKVIKVHFRNGIVTQRQG